jgi:hypothetical protein
MNDPDFILAVSNFRLLESRQFSYDSNTLSKKVVCNQTIQILTPLISKSRNVEYLIPFVKAHHCINKLNLVKVELERLETMGINLNALTTLNKEN